MQPQQQRPAARIGPYDVLDELPPGSTGRAYLVIDGPPPRPEYVAKVLDAPRLLTPRFLTMLEAERPSALAYRHMFASQLRAVDIQPNRVTLVSDMVDGMPLSALLARLRAVGEQLPWEVLVNYGLQVALALRSAHKRPWRADSSEGIFHGRVGPDALYVTYDGYPRVLGVGYGRARRSLPPRLQSLPYLAPELSGGSRLAPQVDVYGLGLTLYDALRGKRSFERETVEQTKHAVATEALPALSSFRLDVPAPLVELLSAMTRKVPSERPASLDEVVARLQGCLSHDDALHAQRLAQTMREQFSDRADLPRRDRCRLRRRLGTSDPARTSWVPPNEMKPEAEEELSELIERFVPSRRISDEAPLPTPAEPIPAPTPPRPTDPVTPTATRTPSAPFDTQPGREPSGAHHTITATIFEDVARRAQAARQAQAPAPAPAPAPNLPPFPPPSEPARIAPPESATPPPVLSPAELDAEAGALIGDKYRIIDILGQGAAAIVYRAEHVLLKKPFAVKVLRPELSLFPYIVERFKREAQSVSKLDHPNIVWVSDFGQTETGAMFIVMPLVEGVTLQRFMLEYGPLDARFAVEVALGTLAGLAHAHAHALVHRDLKPENIMVDGANPRGVRILDFGIAKVAGASGSQRITQTGMIPGTPAYMAPEQAAGETVDARSDLYALGVTLYEMLSGRLPFVGESLVDLLSKVMTDTPPPLDITPHPEVDTRRLGQVIAQAMAKNGRDRFDSADAFADALSACLRG